MIDRLSRVRRCRACPHRVPGGPCVDGQAVDVHINGGHCPRDRYVLESRLPENQPGVTPVSTTAATYSNPDSAPAGEIVGLDVPRWIAHGLFVSEIVRLGGDIDASSTISRSLHAAVVKGTAAVTQWIRTHHAGHLPLALFHPAIAGDDIPGVRWVHTSSFTEAVRAINPQLLYLPRGLPTRPLAELRVLFNGKSVAVVGNGPDAATHADGRLIDECDIVVRFNRFELGEAYPRLGARTDVVVMPLGYSRAIRPDLARFQLTAIVGVCPPWTSQDVAGNVERCSSIAPVHLIDEGTIARLADSCQVRPTTGFTFLHWLLEQAKPDRVYATGFSFRRTKRHHYFPAQTFSFQIHNPEREKMEFIRCYDRWRDRLSVDDTMRPPESDVQFADAGVVVGCDEAQAWLLPWFFANYVRFNSRLPVVIADLGMSPETRARLEREGYDPIFDVPRVNPHGVMYSKPQAIIASPWATSLWLDLDCEVREHHLVDMFGLLADREIAVALDTAKVGARPQAGVIIAKRDSPTLAEWAARCARAPKHPEQDQPVLRQLFAERPEAFEILPRWYNRVRLDDDAESTVIRHWTGPKGKDHIRRLIDAA